METTNQETKHASFLDEDMSQVDTSMPLLPQGLYEMAITEVKEEPSKGGDKVNLVISLKTTKEYESTSGERLNAGFPIFHRICITPTEKLTADAIKKRVATFVQGMNGTKLYPLQQWKDQVATVKLIVLKARTDKETGEEYPESNSVKMFIKPEGN